MIPYFDNYMDAFRHVYDFGKPRSDRTGVGTRSVFRATIDYDLTKGFPLITEKKTWWKGVVIELQWILRGDRSGNIDFMRNRGVHIWDEWADEFGNLGPVYGAQARHWKANEHGSIVDQVQRTIDEIRTNPTSRRMLVSMWNPGEFEQQALPPCHYSYQFYVEEGKLNCVVNQRSADMFLGVPFDIASYALLTHIIAQLTGLGVGILSWSGTNVHIYDNHSEQADQLMKRPSNRALPTLKLPEFASLKDVVELPWQSFELEGYNPYPTISAEVAV